MRKIIYILICVSIILLACKKSNSTSTSISTDDVPDTTPPVITINGASSYKLTLDELYVDLGATAIDNKDGELTKKIEVTGSVNHTLTGNYLVVYNVKDNAGNKAETKSKTIIIYNAVDSLAANYTVTCTCQQYTIGSQAAPDHLTTNSYTTSLVPSKNINFNFALYPFEFRYENKTLFSSPNVQFCSMTANGKIFQVYNSISTENYIGWPITKCQYTFTKL